MDEGICRYEGSEDFFWLTDSAGLVDDASWYWGLLDMAAEVEDNDEEP